MCVRVCVCVYACLCVYAPVCVMLPQQSTKLLSAQSSLNNVIMNKGECAVRARACVCVCVCVQEKERMDSLGK